MRLYMYICMSPTGFLESDNFLAIFFEQDGKSNQEQEQTTQLYDKTLPAMPPIIHCFIIHSKWDDDLK